VAARGAGAAQRRVHELVLFDRNENGPKAHGDLQFEITSLSVRAARPEISRRFAHKPREPSPPWWPVLVLACQQLGKLDPEQPIN
jgi:hypothetical protein